jgi:hypothetical protein
MMTDQIERVRIAPVRFQPKAPDASVERVRQLAGVITLSASTPSADLFDADGDESAEDHARE